MEPVGYIVVNGERVEVTQCSKSGQFVFHQTKQDLEPFFGQLHHWWRTDISSPSSSAKDLGFTLTSEQGVTWNFMRLKRDFIEQWKQAFPEYNQAAMELLLSRHILA